MSYKKTLRKAKGCYLLAFYATYWILLSIIISVIFTSIADLDNMYVEKLGAEVLTYIVIFLVIASPKFINLIKK